MRVWLPQADPAEFSRKEFARQLLKFCDIQNTKKQNTVAMNRMRPTAISLFDIQETAAFKSIIFFCDLNTPN